MTNKLTSLTGFREGDPKPEKKAEFSNTSRIARRLLSGYSYKDAHKDVFKNSKHNALAKKSGSDPYGVKGHKKMFDSGAHKSAVEKGRNSHLQNRKNEPED